MKQAYCLEFSNWTRARVVAEGGVLTPAAALPLARLMVDAYRGTIDYEGESYADAQAWIRAFFSGEAPEMTGGAAVSGLSMGLTRDDALVSACLVGDFMDQAFLSIVMTHPDYKGQGLASGVLCASLNAIQATGQRRVYTAITKGNRPSERLFARMGFVPSARP